MGKKYHHLLVDIGLEELKYGFPSDKILDEHRKTLSTEKLDSCVQVAILKLLSDMSRQLSGMSRQLERLRMELKGIPAAIIRPASKDAIANCVDLEVEKQRTATAKALAAAAKWEAEQKKLDSNTPAPVVNYVHLSPDELERAIDNNRDRNRW